MALKEEGGDVIPTAPTVTEPAIPPPAPAGGEVAEKSVAGQAALPIQISGAPAPSPAPQPATKKQLPTNIPSYQAMFEPQRPEFDWQQYIPRLKNVFNSFAQGFGASPTAAVAHDLTRSGLRPEAIRDLAGDWLNKVVGKGSPFDISHIPGLNLLSPDQQNQIKTLPAITVPNAPFRGVVAVWQAGQRILLVNPDESAPTHEVLDQLHKATILPQDALNFLNKVRQTNPAAVASQMANVVRGDFASAAANVQKLVGGEIGGLKAGAAGAAQASTDIVAKAQEIATNIGLGLVKAQAQIGLINQNDNSPLGIGIGPNGNPNTLLGHISQLVGEATSGQHIGAQATLTDEAYTKLQSDLTDTISQANAGQPISEQQAQTALRDLQVLDPKYVDQAKKLSGWEQALKGGEAAIQFASIANPQGLVMAEAQQSTQSALEENGVDPRIAHIAGDVAGILSLGKGTVSINGLSKAGVAQRIGMGIGALGMGAATYAQTEGEDPLERTADVIAGAVMGSTGLGHVGRQVDRLRASAASSKVIQQALTERAKTNVTAETLTRQAEQAGRVKELQTTADVALIKYNDLQVAQGSPAPAADVKFAEGTPNRPTQEATRQSLMDDYNKRLGAVKTKAEYQQIESELPALQEKVRNVPADEAAPPTPKTDPAALVTARKEWAFAQAAADKESSQLQRQIEGDTNTPHRQAWDAVNTHIAGSQSILRRFGVPQAILENAPNYHQTLRVLAQRVQDEVVKVLGNDKAKWAAYTDALWHPENIDNIQWPEVRQAVIDARAGYADFATQLPDNMKGEILENYSPMTRDKGELAALRSILTPNDPLSVRSEHQLPRAQDERNLEQEGKVHPGDVARQYIESMGRAQINRGIRMALTDAVRDDNTRVFHPEDSLTTERKAPADGHEYVWSNLPGLNGVIDKEIGAQLEKLTNNKSEDIGFGYRAFTQVYKKLAMISPVHPWNQFSASLGVDIDSMSLLKKGGAINGDPALQADWGRYSHVGTDGEGFIYDLSDRVVSKNPVLANMLDHMRSVERQTLGRYDHVVWTSYIRNLQAGIWQTLVEKAVAEGHDITTAKIAAGHMADEITGLTNPKTYTGIEKFVQRYMLFAYSWNRKHITIPAEALGLTKKLNPELSADQADLVTHMARQYIARQQVNSWMMHLTVNMLLSGHPPWENDKGREMTIEWTGLHDMIAGPEKGEDGQSKRFYSQDPNLNFFNFYYSKLHGMLNLGPGKETQGVADEISNISGPIPAFLIQTLSHAGQENLGEIIGRAVQTANPAQRNLLGPLAVMQEKEAGKEKSPLETLESILSAVPVTFTGLHQYEGPASDFVNRDKQLQQARGVGLELAKMGVNPYDATPEQKSAALQKLKAGEVLGINLKETEAMIGGHRAGTDTEYTALNQWLNDSITHAVAEQIAVRTGNSLDSRDEAQAKVASSKDPFSLLDSTEKRLLFQAHPEIEAALDAPSTDPDPAARQMHDALARYNHGLNALLTENHAKQDTLDKAFNAGTMKLADWIYQTQELRSDNAKAFQTLQKTLTPEELVRINKPPSDVTPMLPAETAYWQFRQISYADPKYKDDEGLTNTKAWRQAQQDFLKTLPQDQQDYIHAREIQSQTPLVQKYLTSLTKYQQFKLDNQQWENLRNVYDSLSPFEKKIYRAANPVLDRYLTYRDNWFRTDPDGVQAGEFFHLTDQKQWDQWTPQKQAAAVAEWYVDKWGSVKQQAYLSPWQKQVMGSTQSFNQLTAKWSQAEFDQLQGMLDAYYKSEAEYKANSSAYIKNLLNKIFHRTGTVSPGTQSVLG